MNDFTGGNKGARVANAEEYRKGLSKRFDYLIDLVYLIKRWLIILVLLAITILISINV